MFTTKPPAPQIIRDLQEYSTKMFPHLLVPGKATFQTFFPHFDQNQFEFYANSREETNIFCPLK
jgi:hypothetical protein